MLLKKHKLKSANHGESSIVFDPSTGQTHCLDNTALQVLNKIPKQGIEAEELVSHFVDEYNDDEKNILFKYLDDIIKQLIRLQLVVPQ